MRRLWLVMLLAALPALGLGLEESASAVGDQDASTEPPLSSTPSYYSLAEVWAYEWGHPDTPLKGADLFLEGRLLGKSPLVFKTQLINKPLYALSAQLPGYREGLRPAVKIPAEGLVKVAMLPENPDSWFTFPSFIVGLGLVGAGLATANSGSSISGQALIASGVGVMGAAYTISWIHVPFLEKAVAEANGKSE